MEGHYTLREPEADLKKAKLVASLAHVPEPPWPTSADLEKAMQDLYCSRKGNGSLQIELDSLK